MRKTKTFITVILSGLLAVASPFVAAKPGAGGHAGGQGGQAAGGMSANHMSSQGLQNTNGPNASERATGLDRAEERMSEDGLENSQAREARLKRQAAVRAKAAADGKASVER